MPEVGNMPLPKTVLRTGVTDMVRISDARMSGTAFGTVVLHVNGAFHSDEGLGTAERVRRRLPSAKVVVVSAVPVANPQQANGEEHKAKGDYILLARAPRK
jgi:uncharacterized iron-regulated protein